MSHGFPQLCPKTAEPGKVMGLGLRPTHFHYYSHKLERHNIKLIKIQLNP
jgi:hypothetical protein